MKSTARQQLFMGVANCAEQLWQWGEAIRFFAPDTWRRVTCASLPTGPFDFRSDYVISPEAIATFGNQINLAAGSPRSLPRKSSLTNSKDMRLHRNYRKHFKKIMDSNHIVIDYFAPILNVAGKSNLETDVNFLKQSGKHIAFVAHGSDIRNIAREMTHNPYSPFNRLSSYEVKAIQARVEDNKHQFERCGGKLLYTTPDLEFDAKQMSVDAEWLPVCVDRDLFRWEPVKRLSTRPRVLLAASNPKTKTSPEVDDYLQQMHNALEIDLRYVSNVSHRHLRAHLRWSEIVIDQVGFQGYGVLAVEAMATGRLLFTGAEILESDNRLIGIQTDPARVGDSLRHLMLGTMDIDEKINDARHFARTHHDGRESAAVIAKAFPNLSP